MAVGFWNFVGAGVFGFLINLPIVSYFEVGTMLTTNHGHAAMFGVFGMLALAVLVFCLRAMQTRRGLGGHGEVRARGLLGPQRGARADGTHRPVPRRRPSAVGLPEPTATGMLAASPT